MGFTHSIFNSVRYYFFKKIRARKEIEFWDALKRMVGETDS